ncbi:MAG: hypothetical protein J7M01_02440 [Candidatus Marinimicrobia bacterium]|nr:hypothetical protein [Candidatus Neomarinimicrobiota bacterium]
MIFRTWRKTCINILLLVGYIFAADNDVTISAGRKGFIIRGAEGYEIRFKGFAQSIGYFGVNDSTDNYNDQFILKRARIDTRIKLGKYIEGRVHGDFASIPKLLDAYLQLNLSSPLSLRIGQFKSPLSQERLRSAPSLLFNDFAYTASLAPNRDIGIQLSGKVAKGIFNYQMAYMNGAQDGSSSIGDISDPKEFVGRFTLFPFINSKQSPLRSFSIGVGASCGRQTNETLGSMHTSARTKVFSYQSTTIGNGRIYRISPQCKCFTGKYTLIGEYIIAGHEVSDTGGSSADLLNRAWTLSTGYVLFGGKRASKGFMLDQEMDVENGYYGGMELIARLQGFSADEDSFNEFASSVVSIQDMVTIEGGINWYIADNTCFKLVYSRSSFMGGSVFGDRETEQTISLSANLVF